MLEIRLIMNEKTNSNDKEKKRIYLFYCHFNRNNSERSRSPQRALGILSVAALLLYGYK